MLNKRKALYELKDEMDAEIKEKQSKLEIIPIPRGRKKSGYVNPNARQEEKLIWKLEKIINQKYQIL